MFDVLLKYEFYRLFTVLVKCIWIDALSYSINNIATTFQCSMAIYRRNSLVSEKYMNYCIIHYEFSEI